MKVLAHQSHRRYLIEVADGWARILDIHTNRLSMPNDIQAILKHTGNWEAYTDSQDEVLRRFATAERSRYDFGPLDGELGV